MKLQNLMEEKQLDFHRPLLSVRRTSSTPIPSEMNKKKTNDSQPSLPPLPYYKSDLKSGPIRNPGVIPFQWEMSPGRPKNKSKAQIEVNLKHQPPPTPKLPPGWVVDQKKQKPTDKELKDSPASSSRSHLETVLSSWELSSWEKAISVLQEPDEEMKAEEISSSDDENVKFEDARDKLSRNDSFFLNCSVSGVTGLDDPNADPSGALLDPQVRDFMMGRFLPAAKAVASETPQFASRKHKPNLVKEVAAWSTWAPQKHSTSNTLAHNIEGEGEEEEDEDEDKDKLCGCSAEIIPRIRSESDHIPVISSVRSVCTRTEYGLTDQFKGTKQFEKGSPRNFLCRENGFLGLSKESRDFRVGKFDMHKNGAVKISSPSNRATEKTVYLDSEQMVESWSSNSSSSESRGRNPSVDYSLQDIKPLFGDDEQALSQPKSSDTADSNVFPTSRKLSQDFKKDDDSNSYNNNKSQHGSQSRRLWGKDMTKKRPVKPGPQEDVSPLSRPPLGLAPLLPKSPSESWLSQTLPSVTPKSPSSKLLAGYMTFRPSPIDPKRDRMLKASIVKQHMLLRLHGELAPISED